MGRGLALGPEDTYAGAEAWIEPGASGGAATGSILDSIIGGGSDLIAAITQPDVVKATLNKYVFGSTTKIPMPGQPVYTPSGPQSQWIAGVPNLYLIIGGAAVLFLVMKRR